MPDAWRITPRPPVALAAYGQVWPGEGRTVTAAEVDAGTLQRIDADVRFDVEAIAPDPDPADPKPPTRKRRS